MRHFGQIVAPLHTVHYIGSESTDVQTVELTLFVYHVAELPAITVYTVPFPDI
jgi:hypothetical protein